MENIYNTVGAAKYLKCGIDNIHKQVTRGKLRARKYNDDGVLVEWKQGDGHRGQGLYFLQSDLAEYQQSRKLGRPFTKKESA